MLPPVLERLPSRRGALLLRAGRHRSRTTSRTRSCPRTASSSSRKTLEEGADFGVAFDGDADRCFFVDDTGEFVPGDFATALFAESILGKEPGAKVIYDVRALAGRCRRRSSAPAACRSSTASATRSSSSGCARTTRSSRGEVSGALLLPRLLARPTRASIPFLLMLELDLDSGGGSSRRSCAPFRERYFITGELNTPVARRRAKLQELKERFGPEGRVSAPRRRLGRRRRLALQRPPVEHRAAPAAEPRGALRELMEAQARRGARGYSRLSRTAIGQTLSTDLGVRGSRDDDRVAEAEAPRVRAAARRAPRRCPRTSPRPRRPAGRGRARAGRPSAQAAACRALLVEGGVEVAGAARGAGRPASRTRPCSTSRRGARRAASCAACCRRSGSGCAASGRDDDGVAGLVVRPSKVTFSPRRSRTTISIHHRSGSPCGRSGTQMPRTRGRASRRRHRD